MKKIEIGKLCNKLTDSIEQEDKHLYLKLWKKWAKNVNFYRGNQRGFWDKMKNVWVSIDVDTLPPSQASMLVVNNLFRPQVKTLVKEITRSKTVVRGVPISDSQSATLSARFGDSLIRHYQSDLMPESLRQLEGKYALLFGNSFRYTTYNKDKKSVSIRKDKPEEKTLKEYNRYMCSECGKEEGNEGKATCDCGGVIENTNVPEKKTTGRGYEYQNTGDLEMEIVCPLEIKVSPISKFKETPYLRRLRIVNEEFIKKRHKDYKPKQGDLSDNGQQIRNLMMLTGGKQEENSGSATDVFEYYEYWLEPEKYSDYKTATPLKVDGKEYPEDTPYTQVFKEGFYFVKCGKDVLKYKNECKGKHWIHIPYDNNLSGLWADGLEDAIQNQQIINEYNSLGIENVLYNASPKLIINPRLINPTTLTNRPKDVIPLSDNARIDTKPSDTFSQLQGMSLTQEVMAGIEGSKRDMREQTGALLAFNGQGDDNIQTATGAVVARDSALALISTFLAIKAEKDQEWCWQILNLVKANWYDEKYKFLLGKFSDREAESFKMSDIEHEISLTVEPNSWMPQTNTEKLQALGAFLTAFGLPLGFMNPNIPEPIRQYGSQLYSIPIELNELSPDIRIAQKRLDKAKDLAKIEIPITLDKIVKFGKEMVEVTDIDGSKIQVPQAEVFANDLMVRLSDVMEIEEDIDEHQVFIDTYKKWIKTDEGQTAHPILREAVKTKIREHKKFMQADVVTNPLAMPPQGTEGNPSETFEPQPPPDTPFQPPQLAHRKTSAE